MTTSIKKYKCSICSKLFSKKKYENHIIICDIIGRENDGIKKSKNSNNCGNDLYNDDDETIYNAYQLHKIINHLAIKCKKLENKVEEMSKQFSLKKNNVDVLEYLNTNYNNTNTINIWIEKLKVERKHIEFIFEDNLIDGFINIFKDWFSINNENLYNINIPIRSFLHKKNILYYYSNTEKWEILELEEFFKIMNKIYKKIYIEFVLWQNENLHLLQHNDQHISNEFINKLSDNIIKINGSKNIEDKSIFREIYKKIYKLVITNLIVIL